MSAQQTRTEVLAEKQQLEEQRLAQQEQPQDAKTKKSN
jgi:hypothetical protein